MQVFIPYESPIDVAKCLDSRRLRKQILEADQILAAINGKSQAWKNHPVVKMYSDYAGWLWYYREMIDAYLKKCFTLAKQYSYQCDAYFRPPFITSDFCDQHKRRLYAKDPAYYAAFEKYGSSEENWYVVNGRTVKYVNGKRV